MGEYEQMKTQKSSIIETEVRKVFEISMAALRAGAPGLSEQIKEGIARNIMLRMSGRAAASTSDAMLPIEIIEGANNSNGGIVRFPSGREIILSKTDAATIINLTSDAIREEDVLAGMNEALGSVIPVWEMIDRLEKRGRELNVNGVMPNGLLMLKAAFYIERFAAIRATKSKGAGGGDAS